jgi:hypothetical protein
MDHSGYPIAISMLAGSQHLSLQEAGIHTAGRDMTLSMPTVTVNLNTSGNTISPAVLQNSSPLPNDAPDRVPVSTNIAASTKRKKGRGIVRFLRRKKPPLPTSNDQHSDIPSVDTLPPTKNSQLPRIEAVNHVHEASQGSTSSSSFHYCHGGISVVRTIL